MTPSDVKIVAENINDFIEVPDGINRLRKAVLTLAVAGKLVPQDKSEGTASELYLQTQTERRIKENNTESRKKKREVTQISQEEVPFEIPESWKWVRLGEMCEVNPRNNLPDTLGVSFVPMTRISSEWGKNPDTSEIRLWKDVKTGFTHMAENDVIMAKITPCFENEKSGVARNLSNGYAAGTTEIHVFRTDGKIFPEYLLAVFRTSFFVENAIQNMTGTAGQKRVPTDYVVNALLPLPPLSEQKRIMSKVEEVMVQLDELESQKNERDLVRSRLTRSAMQAFGSVDSKIALEQLSELVKTPQDIKELENAILKLAVSGMIVSQNKSEGTAEEFYSQINAYRVSQENGGIRKKKLKDLPLITPEEIPFAIPESWKWVRIGEISSVKGGKRLPKGSGFADRVTKHPYIRITDMKNGSVNTTNVPYITDEVFEKISRYTISSKDVYVTIAGTIGDAGKIPVELDGANLTENAAKIEFKFIDLDYFVLVLRSTPVKAQFLEKVVQMAQPKLALHRIESSIIPLPPLAEQKRIVKKVEELMSLLEQLKNTIKVSLS